MKKVILVIIILLIIGVAGYLIYATSTDSTNTNSTTNTIANTTNATVVNTNSNTNDEPTNEVDEDDSADEDDEPEEPTYQYQGDLSDVTGGETVTGINTNNQASGVAKARYTDGSYELLATFDGLPEPEGTDFYEGWVVRNNPQSVISTGEAELVDGSYENTYSSDQDLTDHDFYVLTIEPDDGDPAPAGHILEGTMTE